MSKFIHLELPPALPGPKGATGSFTMLLDATTVDIYQVWSELLLEVNVFRERMQ
jgi:hypothetical protein